MAQMAVTTGAGLIVLMVTDIRECSSTLYFAGPEGNQVAASAQPGMVSRKKQLLPWLDHFLRQRRSQL